MATKKRKKDIFSTALVSVVSTPFDYRTVDFDDKEAGANAVMAKMMLEDQYFGYIFKEIHSMDKAAVMQSQKFDINNLDVLKMRFVGFVAFCLYGGVRFGNMAAYSAIGISADDAREWSIQKSKGRPYAEFIKNVDRVCSVYREILAMSGSISSKLLEWWQANYDGMSETRHVEVRTETVLGDILSEEEIKKRIMLDIPNDL